MFDDRTCGPVKHRFHFFIAADRLDLGLGQAVPDLDTGKALLLQIADDLIRVRASCGQAGPNLSRRGKTAVIRNAPRIHEVAVTVADFDPRARVVIGVDPLDLLLEDTARRTVVYHFKLLRAADRLNLDLADAIVDLDTLKPLPREIVDNLICRGLRKNHAARECGEYGCQKCLFHWMRPFMSQASAMLQTSRTLTASTMPGYLRKV